MSEFKTGQDVIENGSGSAMAGFNRRVFGIPYNDAFRHDNERQNGDLHVGWDLADRMILKGKLYYVHNFHHSHECDGFSFQYGGFWVCNSCGKKKCDSPWWTIKVYEDGNAWCCVGLGFEDLQASDNYAFGDTRAEAIKNYGDLMVSASDQGYEQMSTWYESGKDDLEIDGDEINVWVTHDYGGNVYTTIKIADIEALLKERESPTTN